MKCYLRYSLAIVSFSDKKGRNREQHDNAQSFLYLNHFVCLASLKEIYVKQSLINGNYDKFDETEL